MVTRHDISVNKMNVIMQYFYGKIVNMVCSTMSYPARTCLVPVVTDTLDLLNIG